MEEDPQFIPEPNTFPVYSKTCFFKVQVVLQHSQKFKKNMQDFSAAFSKRIQAQLTYQKNLLDCAKCLEKYIQPSSNKSVSYIASGFKVDNEQRAGQAYELANSLKSQVITPIGEYIRDYGNLIKKIEKTAKKISKDYSYFSQNFERAYRGYKENDNIVKQLIITKCIQRYTSQFPQQKKNKLVSKTMESIKEKSQYEKNYRNAVIQFNELVSIYNRQTKESLDELETKQRQLIKLQSDAIRKLIVCEVSMFKNVEYDLINVSKQMEKMYAENDIQEFRKEAEAMQASQKDRNLENKMMQSDESLLNLSLRSVEEQYYPWLIFCKKNKALRKILQLRLKILTAEKSKIEGDKKQIIEQKKQETENQGISNSEEKTEQKQKQKQKNQQIVQVKELSADQSQQLLQKLQNQFLQAWDQLPPEALQAPTHPLFDHVNLPIKKEELLTYFKQLTNLIHEAWSKQVKQKEDSSSSSVISEGRKSKQSPKSSLKPRKRNKTFVSIISKNHFLRIIAYLFIEQYRIQHYVQINARSFQKIAELVSLLIEEAEEKKDVFVIKGILGLLFTFYCTQNQQHKKLLYQHPLIRDAQTWKKSDYWQASIFQSTYEQMASLSVQTGETQAETLLREKNTIFSQLASYCHYMLMLGVTSRQVRVIVGRYCRLYEMSDDQNRDLSKMISNTAKQIKETQMISQAKSQQ